MRIRHLKVVNIPKKMSFTDGKNAECAGEESVFFASQPCFRLETCQRVILLGRAGGPEQHGVGAEAAFAKKDSGVAEVYVGWQAYDFLLKLLTGLESRVFAETEVFGQFRAAWERGLALGSPLVKWLTPTIEKLFSDVKLIRSDYLQGIGGSSYASLSKRLLTCDVGSSPRLLVVGAGELARSFLGVYRADSLFVWNRDAERFAEWRALAEVKRRFELPHFLDANHKELEDAWMTKAQAVVVTIPAGSEWDHVLLSFQKKKALPVVHLGGQIHELTHWSEAIFAAGSSIKTLTDVFELESVSSHKREHAAKLAKAAAEQISKLRALGSTLHTTHCWEDLAFFA